MLTVIKSDQPDPTQTFFFFECLSFVFPSFNFCLIFGFSPFPLSTLIRLQPCPPVFCPPFRSRAGPAVRQPHRHPSGFATSLRVHAAAEQPGERHRPGLPPQPGAGLLVGRDAGPHHEGQPQRLQRGGGGLHRPGEPRWVQAPEIMQVFKSRTVNSSIIYAVYSPLLLSVQLSSALPHFIHHCVLI